MKRIHLADRSVFRLSGADVTTFLQGLISNDVSRADGTAGVYAALLTPQGKYLYDFFLCLGPDGLYLDIRSEDAPALHKKLRMYKLRSDVTIDDVTDSFAVYAFIGEDATALTDGAAQKSFGDASILYKDPRHAEIGVRALISKADEVDELGGDAGDGADYQNLRIKLGLPEAPTDLIADKSILLESGFDELNGVDWGKGCYMGQELTARTKYRGLVKKRLLPVTWNTTGPNTGDGIVQDGKVVGDVRSVGTDAAIAMVRLDALNRSAPLTAGDVALTPNIPDWMSLPEAETSDA